MSSYLETIKSLDGKLYNISYHQKRYESVLDSLGIEKKEDLTKYLDPPQSGLYRCRLVYDADGITVSYHEYEKRDVQSLKLIFDNDIEYSKKYTCRDDLDRLYAKKGDADEILIIKELLVSDTSIANIAFYDRGEWITPRKPLLMGTTRARLLDEGKIKEADIKVQDIKKYSKIALMNAMIDFDVLDNFEFLI